MAGLALLLPLGHKVTEFTPSPAIRCTWKVPWCIKSSVFWSDLSQFELLKPFGHFGPALRLKAKFDKVPTLFLFSQASGRCDNPKLPVSILQLQDNFCDHLRETLRRSRRKWSFNISNEVIGRSQTKFQAVILLCENALLPTVSVVTSQEKESQWTSNGHHKSGRL